MYRTEARGTRYLGLYYPSAKNAVVPDADEPKNGDAVLGTTFLISQVYILYHLRLLVSFSSSRRIQLHFRAMKRWIRLRDDSYLPIAKFVEMEKVLF